MQRLSKAGVYFQGQVWKWVWFFDVRSENGCRKWHFLVWNWVWICGCGRHTTTQNSKEFYPGLQYHQSDQPKCPGGTTRADDKKQQVTILAADNHAILKQQQLLKTCVQTSQKVPRPTEAMLPEPDLDPGRSLSQHKILFSKQVVFSLLCRLSFLSYRKCYVK